MQRTMPAAAGRRAGRPLKVSGIDLRGDGPFGLNLLARDIVLATMVYPSSSLAREQLVARSRKEGGMAPSSRPRVPDGQVRADIEKNIRDVVLAGDLLLWLVQFERHPVPSLKLGLADAVLLTREAFEPPHRPYDFVGERWHSWMNYPSRQAIQPTNLYAAFHKFRLVRHLGAAFQLADPSTQGVLDDDAPSALSSDAVLSRFLAAIDWIVGECQGLYLRTRPRQPFIPHEAVKFICPTAMLAAGDWIVPPLRRHHIDLIRKNRRHK